MKTNKYPISKYFSFYFLGKFESKERNYKWSFIANLTAIILAFVSIFFNTSRLFINILFSLSFIGILSSILISNKFSKMKRGVEYKELNIATYPDGGNLPKEVVSLARSNTFFLSLGIFSSIVNIILSMNVIDLLISILVIGSSLYFLYENPFYKELRSKDKTKKLIILSIITLGLSLILKYLKFNILLGFAQVLPISIICAIIGIIKTSKLLNKLFSKKAKNKYYVDSSVNYGKLIEKETKTYQETHNTVERTTNKTSSLNKIMAEYEREEEEKNKRNIIKNNSLRREYQRMENLKNGYTSTNKNYNFNEAREETDSDIRNSEFYKANSKTKTAGYSTESDNPKDSRFDAKRKR